MTETPVHALDYLHVVRRRKWWLAIPIVLSVFAGVVALQFLPKEYESTATLVVAASVVSPSYVSQATQLDNQERLRALTQQLVSDSILSKVAKAEGLQDTTPGLTEEQRHGRVVAALRRAITSSVPPDGVANANVPEARRLDAFLVSYRDSDPERARRVTDRLASVFIAENSKTRAARAEDTSAFIAEQLRATQQRLLDYEMRLRTAKEAHMGRLPEQTPANLSTLTGLRQQLESTGSSLRGQEDRLSIIERQLDALRQNNRMAAMLHDPARDASSPEGRVHKLERDLEMARTRYTDKHPEIQRLEHDLGLARRAASHDTQRSPAERAAELEADPNHRQLVADREQARLRVRDLQRNEADLKRQIADYQLRVESAPRVEQELAVMVRDYDLERQQYADLSSKLHAATISERVQRTGAGEQFMVLYPATFPSAPTTPVPWRVMLVAVAAGLCLGGGMAFGREYLDRSVHTVRDLKDEFDVPVLGAIGRIETLQDARP